MASGKIAHLPSHLRDELNRRIDKGELGVRLVEWLNTLPEVKEVLKSEFDGREISEQNLSEWKEHGYRRWQAQQRALVTTQEVNAIAGQLSAQPGGAITESLAAILATRYADALLGSGAEITEEMREEMRNQLKLLRSINREVARLCRCQHDRARVQIQRERLGVARERLELEQSKIKNQPNLSPPRPSTPDPETTEEEKARKLKEWLFPRRLFPEKYQDEPSHPQTKAGPEPPQRGIESDTSNKSTTAKEFLPLPKGDFPSPPGAGDSSLLGSGERNVGEATGPRGPSERERASPRGRRPDQDYGDENKTFGPGEAEVRSPLSQGPCQSTTSKTASPVQPSATNQT